jgi:HAE1 family hydrophobic/amphiphilic exporter-1
VFSLWFFKETVNVSSMMGAIMLVGIVVRNGIMLLDCANSLLAEGHTLQEAVYHAAMKRVRPILMTATVTILGLLPLATGWGAGAELQKPLAIAVIGGILTSTILTLVVLPAGARLFMGYGLSKSK